MAFERGEIAQSGREFAIGFVNSAMYGVAVIGCANPSESQRYHSVDSAHNSSRAYRAGKMTALACVPGGLIAMLFSSSR